MSDSKKLHLSLFLLRISIFLVMFMWTLDKFLNPEHAAMVYEQFYFLSGLGTGVVYVIGIVEFVIIGIFLLGRWKAISYGLVTVFHAISTFSTYKQYLAPYEGVNLLFFAAWPMLAGAITLFLLRDQDTWFTF